MKYKIPKMQLGNVINYQGTKYKDGSTYFQGNTGIHTGKQAVVLPEVSITPQQSASNIYNSVEAQMKRFHNPYLTDKPLSGADPIGQFIVEGAVLNPAFKLTGKAVLYGAGRLGSNWARAKMISGALDKGLTESTLSAGANVVKPELSTKQFNLSQFPRRLGMYTKDMVNYADDKLNYNIRRKLDVVPESNNKALEDGNTWLKNWINNPVTQNKVRDINFMRSDVLNPESVKSEFGKGLTSERGKSTYICNDIYDNTVTPYMKPSHVKTVAIHEGTHGWAQYDRLFNDYGINGRSFRDLILKGIKEKPSWLEQEDYNYYTDPGEMHARLMEIRAFNNIKPDSNISLNQAKSIINKRDSRVNWMFWDMITPEWLSNAHKIMPVAAGAAVAPKLINKNKSGGLIKKGQQSLKLPSNYPSKQYVAKSESTNIDPKLTYAKPIGTKTNKNAWYRFMGDHPVLNTAYDAVNTGLYLAAPYTAGVTLPFAAGMTLAQGVAGVDDIIENKPNATNIIDVASLIPGLGLTKVLGKQATRAAARSATKAGIVDLLKPGSFSAARANKAALNTKLLSAYTKGALFLGDVGLDFSQFKNDYNGLK